MINNDNNESKERNRFLSRLRTEFGKSELREEGLPPEPVTLFTQWLKHEIRSGNDQANTMVLATASAEGFPDARIMLLRNLEREGFTFFSNYRSSKGTDMAENPVAALLFFWPESERQVRVKGKIYLLPPGDSDAYFDSRPFESKIGAMVSEQSTVINGRSKLDADFESLSREFRNAKVPRPAYWGGYLLKPLSLEFWQGRPNRLHDRIRYRKEENGKWVIERLMP